VGRKLHREEQHCQPESSWLENASWRTSVSKRNIQKTIFSKNVAQELDSGLNTSVRCWNWCWRSWVRYILHWLLYQKNGGV